MGILDYPKGASNGGSRIKGDKSSPSFPDAEQRGDEQGSAWKQDTNACLAANASGLQVCSDLGSPGVQVEVGPLVILKDESRGMGSLLHDLREEVKESGSRQWGVGSVDLGEQLLLLGREQAEVVERLIGIADDLLKEELEML